MSTCLLVISDGREEYLARTMASIATMLPDFDHKVHVDDSSHQLGFAGAIQMGWRQVLETGADYVWHAEQDFTYNRPVPLEHMIALLERKPDLVQVALMRQPVNEQERATGGIVQCHPEDFVECSDDLAIWTEHRKYFTTNPSVYSTKLCRAGWPQERFSEGVFTHLLLKDPNVRFAFFGPKFGAPWVHHIGDTRAGTGY